MGRNGSRRGTPDDEQNFGPRGRRGDDGERDELGDASAYGPAYDDDASAYGPAYPDGRAAWDDTGAGGALIPLGGDGDHLPAVQRREAAPPVIIPGTGVPMGHPFIARRARPLSMRLAMLTLAACILVTGLFAVTPLGGGDATGFSAFQALSGALVAQRDVAFHWYVAQPGDEVETVANKFGVAIGGIYELNQIPAGQDLRIGQPYKIPDDPFYGRDFRPASPYPKGNGTTTFGSDWWNSYAGDPNPGMGCAPNGGGDPLGYHFAAPNPGAAWVRGFMPPDSGWIHNGIDLSNPMGSPIHAAQEGQVVWAGWTDTGFGYSVRISHCNHLSTLYGHCSQLLVKAGDPVKPGQVIALEGMTGWATGPHLHFSVLIGNDFVNPAAYYPNTAALLGH